jgi:NAD(P)H-flavin reductase
VTGPARFEEVRVLAAWDETAAFRALHVKLAPAAAALHLLPGQVMKVRTGAGEGFFAIASAPATDGTADLLVKRGGRVADALIAGAAPGALLAMTPPFGAGFPVGEAEGRDVLLFAAGSGIAPIRALLQHLTRERDRYRRITLFYGQRRGAEFAYRAEHIEWERHGVRVVLCPSAEDDAWPGVRGRVQEVARSIGFAGARPEEAVAFVAGMTAMVDDVRRTLAGAGIPSARVHANF